MASLAECGQQTPIIVVLCAENRERYLVIDGHKRIAALQQLGRDTVEATVWAMSEAEALLLERSLRPSPQESAGTRLAVDGDGDGAQSASIQLWPSGALPWTALTAPADRSGGGGNRAFSVPVSALPSRPVPRRPRTGHREHRLSPGVRRMHALVGQQAPFDHGRKQMKVLAGLEVTTKAVERTPERG
jgi:hypothetical protein